MSNNKRMKQDGKSDSENMDLDKKKLKFEDEQEQPGNRNITAENSSCGNDDKLNVLKADLSHSEKETVFNESEYQDIEKILADYSYDHNEFCASGSVELRPEYSKLFYVSTDNTVEHIDFTNYLEKDIQKLLDNCVPSPFGKGLETLIDPNVRSAKEIGREKHAFQFSPQMDDNIISGIHRLLGKKLFTIQPYKVNIYEEGDHFKTHRDTVKSKNMVASLVICIPTEFEGGILQIKNERGISISCDWGNKYKSLGNEPKKMEWISFFTDCNHSISTVTKGRRITITYDILTVDAPGNDESQKEAAVKEQCSKFCMEKLTRLINKLDSTKKYGFHPAHVYEFFTTEYEEEELRQKLKGNDLILYDAFHECGWTVKLNVYYPELESYGPQVSFDGRDNLHETTCSMESLLSEGEEQKLKPLSELKLLNKDIHYTQQEIHEYEFVKGYSGNESVTEMEYLYASTIMIIHK